MRAKVSYYGGEARNCVYISGERLAVVGQGMTMFERGWTVNHRGFHITLADIASETCGPDKKSSLWLRKV